MTKIKDLDFDSLDEKWVLGLINKEFTKPEENITSLKILSKFGIGIHDHSINCTSE